MNATKKKIILIAGVVTLLLVFIGFFLKNANKEDPENEKRSQAKNEILVNKKNTEGEIREFRGDENAIIELVNDSRHEFGLPPLARNEKLSRSALAKAQDMERKQYFEHISPEGLQPWFFAEKQDYRYKNFGENLAEGFFSSESVHESWMKSSGHRNNILSEDFKEIGVAIISFKQNGLKSFLIVQHFGTQLESSDSLKIVCSSKIKDHCRDAEKKRSEIKNSIEEQETIIKKIKKTGNNTLIDEFQVNIEKLNKIKEELKYYLSRCEEVMEKCEEWE